MGNAQKTWALIVGIILAIIGIWGFLQSQILGVFALNTLHSILFLVVGLIGIYVGMKGGAAKYNQWIGWIFLVLGILGFIPGINTFLTNLINSNVADSVLHLFVGVVSLVIFYKAK